MKNNNFNMFSCVLQYSHVCSHQVVYAKSANTKFPFGTERRFHVARVFEPSGSWKKTREVQTVPLMKKI